MWYGMYGNFNIYTIWIKRAMWVKMIFFVCKIRIFTCAMCGFYSLHIYSRKCLNIKKRLICLFIIYREAERTKLYMYYHRVKGKHDFQKNLIYWLNMRATFFPALGNENNQKMRKLEFCAFCQHKLCIE